MVFRKLRDSLEQAHKKYKYDLKDYQYGKEFILTFLALDTIKKLNREIQLKNEEVQEQNNLNLKFSEMIERQNEKMRRHYLVFTDLEINEKELHKVHKKLKKKKEKINK